MSLWQVEVGLCPVLPLGRARGLEHPYDLLLADRGTSDNTTVDDLIGLPVAKPRLMLVDKGYYSDHRRGSPQLKGIASLIRPRANCKVVIARDYRAHRDRNQVERMCDKLNRLRRIVARNAKSAVSFLGFLALAAAKGWMPTNVNRT